MMLWVVVTVRALNSLSDPTIRHEKKRAGHLVRPFFVVNLNVSRFSVKIVYLLSSGILKASDLVPNSRRAQSLEDAEMA